MSTRERWVVYPLLLFAFLLAARDTIIPRDRIQCSTIACQQMTIQSSDGKSAIRLTTTEDDAGLIVVHGCRLDPSLPGSELASKDEFRHWGDTAVRLSGDENGGFIEVRGAQPGSDLFIGHDGQQRFSGLAARNKDGEYVAPSSDANASGSKSIWGAIHKWTAPKAAADKSTTSNSAEQEQADSGSEPEMDTD